MKTQFSVIFSCVICTVFLSGCSVWRQITTPATWGMSLPEIWEYDLDKNNRRKLDRPLVQLLDAETGEPIPGVSIVAIPGPAIHPLGSPGNRSYTTDQNGMALLDGLPTGSTSLLLIRGETSVPLSNFLENDSISVGGIRLKLLDPPADEQTFSNTVEF